MKENCQERREGQYRVPVFEIPKVAFKTLDSVFLPMRQRVITFREATPEEIQDRVEAEFGKGKQ